MLDDAMGDDDLKILKKFYLTSAELMDDKEVLKKKNQNRESRVAGGYLG